MSELPPGETELLFQMEPCRPGPFGSELHIFLDDGGVREIIFGVRGEATAPD